MGFGLAEAAFGGTLDPLAGGFPPFKVLAAWSPQLEWVPGGFEFSNIGPGSNNKVVQSHIRFRSVRTKPQDLFGVLGPVREMSKPISKVGVTEIHVSDFKLLP